MKGSQFWGGALDFEDSTVKILEGKHREEVQDLQFFWEFLIIRENFVIFPDT